MAVKRRVVWFSDDDWQALQAKAEGRGFTISEYLRRLTSGSDIGHSTWDSVKATKTGQPVVLRGPKVEVEHSTWGRGPVEAAPDRFSTRPFTPVPKGK